MVSSQCSFEKSCATTAFVLSVTIPAVWCVILIAIIGVNARKKKPFSEYQQFVIYLSVLVGLIGTAVFLKIKVPGILCGFFIVYLGVLFFQPILSWNFFK